MTEYSTHSQKPSCTVTRKLYCYLKLYNLPQAALLVCSLRLKRGVRYTRKTTACFELNVSNIFLGVGTLPGPPGNSLRTLLPHSEPVALLTQHTCSCFHLAIAGGPASTALPLATTRGFSRDTGKLST